MRPPREANPGTLAYLLFLLALLPRAHLLALGTPFWFDEDWTEETGLLPLGAMLARVAREDFHPLGGYLLLGLWARPMHALGLEAEVFYRLLPALLGSLSAVVLYRTLLMILPPGRALLVALVYALVPQGVLQDVEFRQYAPAKLAVALALEAALRGRPWAWAAYGALAFHLHYLGGLVAASSFLALRRPWGGHLLALALPVLAWSPVLLGQASGLSGIARWVGSPEERLPDLLSLLLFSQEPLLRVLGLVFWALALGGLLLSPLRGALGVLALGVGALYLLGFQPLTPRYAYLLLPLLGLGLGWLHRHPLWGVAPLVPLGILLLGWASLWPWVVVSAWATFWPPLAP